MSGNSRDIASQWVAGQGHLVSNTLTRYFTTKMQQQSHNKKIILASSSPYRKLLLERLPLEFETVSPDTDESVLPGETPRDLVRRLALAKARSVADKYPSAIVIGSDQVAECDGAIIGKPGDAESARQQLAGFSGRRVVFLSGFAVVQEESHFLFEQTVSTEVEFRSLGAAEIARYVERDNPVDCAGSFKSECGGTMLLRHMRSDDPTAIMGLPLIALSQALRQAGVTLP
jgi:septum formation protein